MYQNSTQTTVNQAPPEPSRSYASKVSCTPPKVLPIGPSTPARWEKLVEEEEAIQRGSNEINSQDVFGSPPTAEDIILEAPDTEEPRPSGEPLSLIHRIGELDGEMGRMVEKLKNMPDNIGLLPLEDLLKRNKRSPGNAKILLKFFFVGLQSGLAYSASEQHTKFLEMMKSDQKVISKLKSGSMLTSQSMMGYGRRKSPTRPKRSMSLARLLSNYNQP